MDLRDLEWKYYKGITTWKQRASDSCTKIPYNSEKRFVKSREMHDDISPPLIYGSLVVCSEVDYPKSVTYSS